tara:strand:+ start:2068 stop:2646 length:579 start_codon:yes stop_codon:yes gene_type:complete
MEVLQLRMVQLLVQVEALLSVLQAYYRQKAVTEVNLNILLHRMPVEAVLVQVVQEVLFLEVVLEVVAELADPDQVIGRLVAVAVQEVTQVMAVQGEPQVPITQTTAHQLLLVAVAVVEAVELTHQPQAMATEVAVVEPEYLVKVLAVLVETLLRMEEVKVLKMRGMEALEVVKVLTVFQDMVKIPLQMAARH